MVTCCLTPCCCTYAAELRLCRNIVVEHSIDTEHARNSRRSSSRGLSWSSWQQGMVPGQTAGTPLKLKVQPLCITAGHNTALIVPFNDATFVTLLHPGLVAR